MARFRLALSFAALSLAGCSGELTTSPEQPGATDQLVGKCSATEYAQAAEAYGRAIVWSKDRLASGVCESEHGYLWSIADEASRAVMSCAGFRELLRSSADAAPVREALAPSLSLRSITGELLVIRDSEFQNWTGVEQFFERGGLSFWARAEGAYGPAVRIDFAAGGKATHGHQVYDEGTGDITWGSSPASYRIEKTGERAGDKRVVIVEVDGRTERYTLTVREPYTYRQAPIFALEPAAPIASEVAPTGEAELHELFSLVSECDA